jgi:hypothetical protein
VTDISKIKDRIRKLLNLAADDGAAEGEIDNALRAARHLMMAHQLSEDDVTVPPEDLRSPEEIADDAEYGTAKSWGEAEREPAWKGSLAVTIASFIGTVKCYHDCPMVHRKPTGIVANDGRPVYGWVFYGPHDDCILAAELHQEILLTCATAAKLKFGGSLMRGPGRDYCDGFARGLANKVYESQRALEKEAAKITGALAADCRTLSLASVQRATAIAVAKQERARDWLTKEKGVLLQSKSVAGRSIRDEGAYGEGKADGHSQSLSKTRVARIGQR